jgi:hypothetical protein
LKIKQRKVESKKKIQTFLLKVINFVGFEAEFKTMLKKVSRHTFVIKDYKLDSHDAQCIAEFPSARQVKDATYVLCHQFSPVSYPFESDVWQVHRWPYLSFFPNIAQALFL